MTAVCNLPDGYLTDNLDEYPSLGPLFAEKGLTASELDQLLSWMERAVSDPQASEITKDDAASIHGDAIILYADMMRCDPGYEPCETCGMYHT